MSVLAVPFQKKHKIFKPQRKPFNKGIKKYDFQQGGNRQCDLTLPLPYLEHQMYESSTLYTLDLFNSISISSGKIYNLFKIKSQNKTSKTTKCKCSKSGCSARYCDCFAKGNICSVDCQCVNCENKTILNIQARSLRSEMGCKCSKSQCQKNYCQCFQKKEKCTQKCRCVGCKNCL